MQPLCGFNTVITEARATKITNRKKELCASPQFILFCGDFAENERKRANKSHKMAAKLC